MAGTRKIAAILVADIVGYSRPAGADVDRALSRPWGPKKGSDRSRDRRALRAHRLSPAVWEALCREAPAYPDLGALAATGADIRVATSVDYGIVMLRRSIIYCTASCFRYKNDVPGPLDGAL